MGMRRKIEKKLLFIFNPYSGKAQIKNRLLDIIDIFVKGGYEVTVYPTQGASDAYRMIRKKASAYDMLVISGGDGTLNEGVRGLMELEEQVRPKFGYIPTGTTNDFATTLNLSKNMLTAARTIITGRKFSCDIGKFQEGYFAYVAAFGAFTDVAYDTPQQNKNMLGHMAYILEGIKRLSSIKSYTMLVECEEQTIEDTFIFGMVTNATSVGGIKAIANYAVDLNDGKFEVVLIKKPNNPLDLQVILTNLLRQDFSGNHMYAFKTSKITFTSEEEVYWTLDGEFGGGYRTATIENMKSAITIMVSDKEREALLLENKTILGIGENERN